MMGAILGLAATAVVAQDQPRIPGQNPLFTDVFTADPAPMVYKDTLYLYTGHDEARGDQLFRMNDWLVFSTRDMKHWTAHGPVMRATDFAWASRDAWAMQVTEKKGKFYLYAPVRVKGPPSTFAIGVAVSDTPTGPFRDARGTPLVTNEMTKMGKTDDEDIDPTVFTDNDGTSWLAWGHFDLYLAKLKPNMTELDGPIRKIDLPNYTEGPWLHKHKGIYYLSYASIDEKAKGAERIAYATATSMQGPWTYRGLITGKAKNSYTIHPGIVQFRNRWYLFYHNAVLNIGDQKGATGRRAVAVDYLCHNKDGSIRFVEQTERGVTAKPPACEN
ncbi:glycoside hydrolase family 43 protein [Sphingomonadaceae bacterium jetA1]|uniref:glycoside hydrolase family 43 protein n=1 Tax=Facivitalis istanbulensis TaxID=3075838 RepID=UPI003479045F